jgi:hypothetical protein
VTVIFHALWMLCLLSAVVFAAVAAHSARLLAATALGYAAASALSGPDRSLDPEIAGLVAAAGTLVYLFRPRHDWLAAAAGGALAGMFVDLLVVAGAPFTASLLLTALLMFGTVWLARTRPAFASEALREEALLVICLIGLVVAVLPSVLDGWQAAANLNVRAENEVTRVIPVWTLTVVAMSMLCGVLYSLWSRR